MCFVCCTSLWKWRLWIINKWTVHVDLCGFSNWQWMPKSGQPTIIPMCLSTWIHRTNMWHRYLEIFIASNAHISVWVQFFCWVTLYELTSYHVWGALYGHLYTEVLVIEHAFYGPVTWRSYLSFPYLFNVLFQLNTVTPILAFMEVVKKVRMISTVHARQDM